MEQLEDSYLSGRPIAPTVLRAISATLREETLPRGVAGKICVIPFDRGIKIETSPTEMSQDDFEQILKTIDNLARKFRLSIVEQKTLRERELVIVFGNFA